MTPAQRDEWEYRYQERIAILCGNGEPTEYQKQMAAKEADEALERMKNGN